MLDDQLVEGERVTRLRPINEPFVLIRFPFLHTRFGRYTGFGGMTNILRRLHQTSRGIPLVKTAADYCRCHMS